MQGLTPTDFYFIRDMIYGQTAITLGDGKAYLVEARLGPVARNNGLGSIHALVQQLRRGNNQSLAQEVIDAMTTNETWFFRDQHPFELMRDHVLPELIEARRQDKRLTIWSAACSTGQEPYSIAVMLRENFPELADWKVQLIATDISADALAKARQGVYQRHEIARGLPTRQLLRHFEKKGVRWQIKPEIREMVTFQPINLAKPWGLIPRADIIFLRNVMIYFDVKTKRDILQRVRRHLRNDGYLFLGAAESTMNIIDHFERVQFPKAACYRLLP